MKMLGVLRLILLKQKAKEATHAVELTLRAETDVPLNRLRNVEVIKHQRLLELQSERAAVKKQPKHPPRPLPQN